LPPAHGAHQPDLAKAITKVLLDAGNHFHDGADGKLRAMEKIAMGIEKKLTMN
jgi:hypothetical protein